eukprot:COSAG02_NODE_13057_length_1451_cov_454.759615_2_plen_88_part_01
MQVTRAAAGLAGEYEYMQVKDASVAEVCVHTPVEGSMTGRAPHVAPPAGGGGGAGPNGFGGGGGGVGVTPPPLLLHVPGWLQMLFVHV